MIVSRLPGPNSGRRFSSPGRELILKLVEEVGQPLSRKQIAQQFNLEGDEPIEALRRRLRAMERDGQLLFNRNKCYCLINNKDLFY